MNITLQVEVDTSEIEDAILSQLEDSLTQVDGVGADGTSEYEVLSVSLDWDSTMDTGTVTVEVERTGGKFAAKDEVADALADAADGLSVDLPIEVAAV